MPWELGYFDALKGNVGVMPLVSRPDDVYAGSEYVLLYPTVDITAVAGKLIATVGGVPIRSWISPGYKPGFLRST
jgi:hypothetical protein